MYRCLRKCVRSVLQETQRVPRLEKCAATHALATVGSAASGAPAGIRQTAAFGATRPSGPPWVASAWTPVASSASRSYATDVEYKDRPDFDSIGLKEAQSLSTHAGRVFKMLSVNPGCTLRVQLPHAPVDVHVVVGENDSIAAEASASAGAVADFLDVRAPVGGELLEVLPLAAPTAAADVTLLLRVWVPERFCNVEVVTAGGSVHVANVTEGALRVLSNGGHVTFGKIRTPSAEVHSGGGSVSADVIAAMLTLSTGGGSVAVNRMVGGTVHVSTEGGDTSIETLYAETASITSGGGKIRIGSAKIDASGEVQSMGGDVCMNGLDGVVSVRTGGGAGTVQLQEYTRRVQIDTRAEAASGAVDLRVPDRVAQGVRVNVEAAGGVAIQPPLTLDGEVAGGRAEGLLKGVVEEGSAHRLFQDLPGPGDDQHAGCNVSINAGTAAVDIRQRTWLDALKASSAATSRKSAS